LCYTFSTHDNALQFKKGLANSWWYTYLAMLTCYSYTIPCSLYIIAVIQ